MKPPPTRLTRFLYTARAYAAFAWWRFNMTLRENQ